MSSPASKASWTPEFHRIFVDLCLGEMLKNEPGSTRITKAGWRNIVGSFYAKTGVRYDKKQFKNHYDSTRKLWKVWVKLTEDSNMKWDPETGAFGASEEDWQNYVKVWIGIINLLLMLIQDCKIHLHSSILIIMKPCCHRQFQKLPSFSLRKSSLKTNWISSLMEGIELRK